jgi:hypothetical protein
MKITSAPIEVGKEFLNGFFEARKQQKHMRENIKIIEEMFPNEDISQVLKKLDITDSELKKTEYNITPFIMK